MDWLAVAIERTVCCLSQPIVPRRALVLAALSFVTVEALNILPTGVTLLWNLEQGGITYWTTAIKDFADTPSIYIALSQGYGAATFYATTMYNGTPATLPGPTSHVCKWMSSVIGSSASVLISTNPNVSSPGGCPDISTWPQPLSITIATVIEQEQLLSPLIGSPAAFGLSVHIPSMFNTRFPAMANSIVAPPIVYDRQMIDTFSVANSQPAGVALGILSDRFVKSNPQNSFDSVLITVSPQLSDGDYAVFIMTADSMGDDAEPICEPPSNWPSPDQPVCSPWVWSFTTSIGCGMLYIDGADPCNATRMRNVAGGPTPRVNPVMCSSTAYALLDILWIVMVPLPTPSTAKIPAGFDDRAGSQQLIPQMRTIPTSARTAGMPWSLPLVLADGAPIRAVTVPYTMCPLRGPDGSCLGDPSTWTVASAALYFMTTESGYNEQLNDHVDVDVTRLCVGESWGLSPVPNASILAPRQGLCGPPLVLYIQVIGNAFETFIKNPMAWADAFSYNISLKLDANESSVHMTLPPTLCVLNGAHSCAYVIAVVVNCTGASAASSHFIGDCPQSGVDDGSVRVLHQVSFTSSHSVRTLGPECLVYGAPCVVRAAAGLISGAAYRFALPTVTEALPPLLVWIQFSSEADRDVFLCQEPLGYPGSNCVDYAMPPYQPRGATGGFDATARVRGGAAFAILTLNQSDLTGSGRPYFRAYVSLSASPASLIYYPNVTSEGRSLGVPRAAGVPYSLVIAAGPTLLFVPPVGSNAVTVTPSLSSVVLTLQPCGFGLSTDPAFPAPVQLAAGYTIEAFALLPQWFNASTDPSGLHDPAAIVLSTPVGVRLALDRASQFGRAPAAFLNAAATLAGGAATLSIDGLAACTTYRLGIVARCATGSSSSSGCLPYYGEAQEVAYPAPFNFTTLCVPPPPSPTPAGSTGGVSLAEKAGIIGGVAVVCAALVIGIALWCRRKRVAAIKDSEDVSYTLLPTHSVQ